VTEAAAIPWPHINAGQVAAAAVVVKGNLTYEQLQKYCSKRLVDFKVPVVIAFRQALPKNAIGKVLKQKLAAQMQAQLAKSNKAKP
jgi:long-chain acyl-CoA synthetase